MTGVDETGKSMEKKISSTGIENKILRFADSQYEYIITGELGRGGSSIVYDGYYVNHTGAKRPVRIREIASASEKMRENIRRVFDVNNKLFETAGLTNRIVNTYEIHEKDTAVYIITTYQEGTTLDKLKLRNLRGAIGAVRGLAHTLDHLHAAGYLYLDVKPANVLVLEGENDWVQLFDFDSVVKLETLAEKIDCGKKTSKNSDGEEILSTDAVEEVAALRYTKEFAAYEQKAGDVSHIGPWTDVYGVGAVLFWLLFDRAPSVFDCDEDSVYDVERWLLGSDKNERLHTRHIYRDGIAGSISDMLHKTLARSYKDRYQSMHELAEALDRLYADADETTLYVKSSPVAAVENVVGREKELGQLFNWFEDTDKPCIYVTGMGGIGKSTIVRKFIKDNRKHMDVVLYLGFANSVMDTVCDDDGFYINTVSRQKGEITADYFQRKLRKLREYLVSEELKCTVVIENCEPGYEAEINAIINAGCRVVIVTRNDRIPECYDVLRVKAFADRKDLYELIWQNLSGGCIQRSAGIDTTVDERFDRLIDSVHGHTLMLALISRQIRRGYMSFDKACELISQNGFAALDDVEAGCTIDGRILYGHMTRLITEIFHVDRLGQVHRSLLVTLSLFGDNGIYVHDLVDITGLDILNAANDLIDGGWIELHSGSADMEEGSGYAKLALHPVIAQAVRQMCAESQVQGQSISDDMGMAAECLGKLARLIEHKRNAEQKRKLEHIRQNEYGDDAAQDKRKGCAHNMVKTGSADWNNTDIHRLERYGMTVADNCLKTAALEKSAEYLALASQIITGTGIENENFILRHGRVILARACCEKDIQQYRAPKNADYDRVPKTEDSVRCCENAHITFLGGEQVATDDGQVVIDDGQAVTDEERVVTDEDLMKIADRMAHICTDRGELEATEAILNFLDGWSQRKGPYAKGFVCDVWTDYIDSLLNGCFVPESDDEMRLCTRQMKTMDQAIRFYEQSDTVPARCRLAEDLIAKATYLIRSVDYEHDLARLRTRRDVVNILNRAKQLMDEVDDQFAGCCWTDQKSANDQYLDWQNVRLEQQNRHAYFMAKAWFYTYIEPDIQKAERSIHSAQKIYENSCESELDLINYLMIPAANIYFELGDTEKCLKWLRRAVKTCEKNDELAAFGRKREELLEIMESEGL